MLEKADDELFSAKTYWESLGGKQVEITTSTAEVNWKETR
jgi:hypothetical protein